MVDIPGRSCGLLVERVKARSAAATSLPLGSYNVMRLLHAAPGGPPAVERAGPEPVHLSRSGVTRLASRLERERGYCVGGGGGAGSARMAALS